MKLYSRLLIVFVEIYAKEVKFGYLNPILFKLEVTRELVMARWKAHGRLSIRLN